MSLNAYVQNLVRSKSRGVIVELEKISAELKSVRVLLINKSANLEYVRGAFNQME